MTSILKVDEIQNTDGKTGIVITPDGSLESVKFPEQSSPSGRVITSTTMSSYEEGTFTATLKLGTTTLMTSPTNACVYTKVGNLVTYFINFDNNPYTARGALTGNPTISGLPFTSSSTPMRHITSSLFQTDTVFLGSVNSYQTNVPSNGNMVAFSKISGGTCQDVREDDMSNSNLTNTYLRVSGSYITNE